MRRLVFALVATALLMVPGAVAGQDAEWNRYTLDGLGGVFVHIEANDVCQGLGAMASDFEASTSLKLIDGEVGVLTRAEMLENPAIPELRVDLDCVGSGDAVGYVVGLRVQQAAQMLRDTQITLPEAVTWYTTKLGVTSGSKAASDLEAALNEKLEEFVTAWTAANAEDDEGR